MSLLDQAIALFTEAPGSLIYHFGVLFAIEAALGIALGFRERPQVRRVVWAACGMLIGRLALMVVALLDMQGMVSIPAAVLPPLERAVDAMGTWLIIWALLPVFDSRVQWGDLLSAGVMLVLLILYAFFAVNWNSQVVQATEAITYNASLQETVWEVVQLGMLAAAAGYTMIDRRGDWGLALGIILVLFAAHLAHYGWAAGDTSVAGWERLGQLVAYPLMTVAVYRLVLSELMSGQDVMPALPRGELIHHVQQLGDISMSADSAAAAKAAVLAIVSMTGAGTVAMLRFVGGEAVEVELDFFYRDGQFVPRPPKLLTLDDVPALRRALNHKQILFLRPSGRDNSSRLALLMQLMPDSDLDDRVDASLLIQPVFQGEHLYGALLAAWSGSVAADTGKLAIDRKLFGLVAEQLAAAQAQASNRQRWLERTAQLGNPAEAISEEELALLRGQQIELDEVRHRERELARQLDVAQREHTRARQHAQDLAVLLDEQTAQVQELTEMVQAQAEAAAADEERLLAAMAVPDVQPQIGCMDEERASQVAQELRQPVTSISGYTDLLLSESVGAVGELQRLFLQRVKVSSERAKALLDELIHVATAAGEVAPLDPQPVDVSELVEAISTGFREQIADQEFDLQVDLADTVPAIIVDRDRLEQILIHLISNAVQVSPEGGKVTIGGSFQRGDPTEVGNGDARRGYLFLSVQDTGGGVALDDQPHVFERGYWASREHIEGLADMPEELPLVQELVDAQRGRIWIESVQGVGSTFSMVLPVSIAEQM